MFTLIGFALLALVSCNNIDSEVVDKVQTSLTKVQESKTGIDGAAKDVSNLQEQMNTAPAGLRNTKTFGYNELAAKVGGFGQKYSSMQAAQAEISAKLETLMGDYVDGKVKKEVVVKEEADLIGQIEAIQSQLDRMTPMFNEISAEYAKMMATWQSLPEAEQQALSNAPAPESAGPPSPTGIIMGPAPAPAQQTTPTRIPGTLADPQPAKKQ